MTIHVTQEHIDNGVGGDCMKCAVALALNEATKTRWVVAGTASTRGRSFRLSEFVKKFMRAFDQGEDVAPISFDLPVEPDGGTAR